MMEVRGVFGGSQEHAFSNALPSSSSPLPFCNPYPNTWGRGDQRGGREWPGLSDLFCLPAFTRKEKRGSIYTPPLSVSVVSAATGRESLGKFVSLPNGFDLPYLLPLCF